MTDPDKLSYRHDAGPERPRDVRFASLSKETQARLIAACHGDGEALLVSWSSLPGGAWLGGAVSLGGALMLGSQLSGFGDLARQPPPLLQGAVAGLGAGLVLVGLLLSYRSLRSPALPAGVFVLPLDLVDTRSDPIRIFPTSMLQQIRAEGGRLRLRFEGGFTCELPGHGAAAATLGRALQAAQQRVEEATAQGDEAALRRLDPFHDERARWPSAASSASPAGTQTSRRLGLLLALLAGQAIGWPAASQVRLLSDERGLAKAERERDDEALRGYIERGGLLAERADAIRLGIARSIEGDGGLLRYLSSGGRRDEADDELFLRQQPRPTERGLEAYLRVGKRHAAEADAMLVELLERAHDEAALRDYALKRRPQWERVTRELIPQAQRHQARLQLEQAAQRGDITELRDIVARRALPPPEPGASDLRAEATAHLARLRTERLGALRQRLGATSPLMRMIEAGLAATSSPTEPLGVRMTVRYSPDESVQPSRQGTPPQRAMDAAARSFFQDLLPGFLVVLNADNDAPSVSPSISRTPDRRPPGLGDRLAHTNPNDAVSIQLPRPPVAEGATIELDYDLRFDPEVKVYALSGRLRMVNKKERVALDIRTHCEANRTLNAVATLEAALRDSLSPSPPCR